ncbi:uncharacterized protein [Physcomitrium patens]|uniref:Secondary thiamine-phosphate synthase enzyme n=1 Tax=Physcomitrium patens TaxID=3218 RepID=A0A7I4D3M3_PHYPA|nr:uncharacterized protein LOC112292882 isoform X1 [Physcomitrium patens]|eukprot:XP_024397590.1 uncharacterized protein LOC112292882 isoform X1 [Physcomitrella patens]
MSVEGSIAWRSRVAVLSQLGERLVHVSGQRIRAMACVAATIGAMLPSSAVSLTISRIQNSASAVTQATLLVPCIQSRRLFKPNLVQDLQQGVKSCGISSRPSHRNVTCEAGTETVSSSPGTVWVQRTVELPPFKRGCHIITKQIYNAVPEINQFRVGIAHLFVLHTSASLTINENASSDVPLDMEDALNRIVPEGNHYRHLDEGYDDMPAHVKASMMGSSLTIPITGGRFKLGIWQGIWLNEHRNYGGSRSICITIQGEKRADGRVYK